METNAEYFRRRAREEFFAAIRAGHHKARRAHLDMAARYEDLVRDMEKKEPALSPESTPNTAQITENVKICV